MRPVPHVAVVDGRPISVERLEQRMTEIRRGPRGRHLPPDGGLESVRARRWIVQELVTEAVLAHEARAAGLIPSEAADHDPTRSTPSALPATAVAGLVDRVTFSAVVATRDVRAYYVRNRDRYRDREARSVRHILLSDEPSARRIAGRIAAGDEMAVLAEADSIDAGSRAQGGELGDVHRGELTGPLEDAIFEAEIGAVIGPIRTEHGWHVARVDAVTPASCVSYAEARPGIEAELLAAERTRMFAAWLERRRAALAVIEPGFEHPAHPIHGVPSHRH